MLRADFAHQILHLLPSIHASFRYHRLDIRTYVILPSRSLRDLVRQLHGAHWYHLCSGSVDTKMTFPSRRLLKMCASSHLAF